MSEHEYHRLADETLDHLQEQLEVCLGKCQRVHHSASARLLIVHHICALTTQQQSVLYVMHAIIVAAAAAAAGCALTCKQLTEY